MNNQAKKIHRMLFNLWRNFPEPEKLNKKQSNPGSTLLLEKLKDLLSGDEDEELRKWIPSRRNIDTKINEFKKNIFNIDEFLDKKSEMRVYFNTLNLLRSIFEHDNYSYSVNLKNITKYSALAYEHTFHGFSDPNGNHVDLIAQLFVALEIIHRLVNHKNLTDIDNYFACKPWLDKGEMFRYMFLEEASRIKKEKLPSYNENDEENYRQMWNEFGYRRINLEFKAAASVNYPEETYHIETYEKEVSNDFELNLSLLTYEAKDLDKATNKGAKDRVNKITELIANEEDPFIVKQYYYELSGFSCPILGLGLNYETTGKVDNGPYMDEFKSLPFVVFYRFIWKQLRVPWTDRFINYSDKSDAKINFQNVGEDISLLDRSKVLSSIESLDEEIFSEKNNEHLLWIQFFKLLKRSDKAKYSNY